MIKVCFCLQEQGIADLDHQRQAEIAQLKAELETARALAAHPLHQLYELKPFLGMNVAGSSESGPTITSFSDVPGVEDPYMHAAEGSPAEAAGIAVGDRLVSVGGVPVTGGRQLDQRTSS